MPAPNISNNSDQHQHAKEKKYRILETITIPNGGAHSCTLRQGKTISSFGYDIAKLKSLGVKLAEEAASG